MRTCFFKKVNRMMGLAKIYRDGTEIIIGKNKERFVNRPLKRKDIEGLQIDIDLERIDNKYSNIYYRLQHKAKVRRLLNPIATVELFDKKEGKIIRDKIEKLRQEIKRKEKYIIPCIYEFSKRPRETEYLYTISEEYNPETGDPEEHDYVNGD